MSSQSWWTSSFCGDHWARSKMPLVESPRSLSGIQIEGERRHRSLVLAGTVAIPPLLFEIACDLLEDNGALFSSHGFSSFKVLLIAEGKAKMSKGLGENSPGPKINICPAPQRASSSSRLHQQIALEILRLRSG